ncbi:MAG: peroxisomal 3,2-trans-enoyl-CoA isomerase [Myxococcota bacterium]|jgi:peroxisomal 3,2-trans-enoyl-CoA isomerase
MTEALILRDVRDNVATLTMNNPTRLNGWTGEMMDALKAALREADRDDEVGAVVLTGAGDYYSAGVNLSSTIQPQHPKKLHRFIVEHNQALFDAFLDLDKPILVAANGPAIGAVVTSATLCDGIIASDRATFSTPFARLGITPEGCSSVLFERLMGADAVRMLGPEGWKPTAQEALDTGLVGWVVPHDQLADEAHRIAAEWAAGGKMRSFRGDATREELHAVNARESVALADAFLSPAFLDGQYRFLRSRKKHGPALMFLLLRLTHPLWSLLLPRSAP